MDKNIIDLVSQLDPDIKEIISLPFCAELTTKQRSLLDIRMATGNVLVRVFQSIEGKPVAAHFCTLKTAKQTIKEIEDGKLHGIYEINFNHAEHYMSPTESST